MASIHECTVIVPPTSEAVRQAAFAAMEENKPLELTVRGEQEVPHPEDTPVSFRIMSTTHPYEGGMRVAGQTPEGSSVIVTIAQDLGSPAVAHIVRP